MLGVVAGWKMPSVRRREIAVPIFGGCFSSVGGEEFSNGRVWFYSTCGEFLSAKVWSVDGLFGAECERMKTFLSFWMVLCLVLIAISALVGSGCACDDSKESDHDAACFILRITKKIS